MPPGPLLGGRQAPAQVVELLLVQPRADDVPADDVGHLVRVRPSPGRVDGQLVPLVGLGEELGQMRPQLDVVPEGGRDLLVDLRHVAHGRRPLHHGQDEGPDVLPPPTAILVVEEEAGPRHVGLGPWVGRGVEEGVVQIQDEGQLLGRPEPGGGIGRDGLGLRLRYGYGQTSRHGEVAATGSTASGGDGASSWAFACRGVGMQR